MVNILKNLIASKEANVEELRRSLIEVDDKEQRMAIGETLTKLEKEIADLRKAAEEMEEVDEEEKAPEGRSFVVGAMGQANNGSDKETRAKEFKSNHGGSIETRAVLVSSGDVATPTGVGGISDAQNAVSSIVDMVKITDAEGMGAYKVAYQISDGTAGAQTESGAYPASDPTFDYVEIKPQTQAILSYVSKQVKKQSPLNYQEKVTTSAVNALRKAAAKVITDAIVASDINDEVALTALDETALRKIALTYGGNENIEGEAVLFINKTDLITLGDVRGTEDKKAVYEITPDASNPNVGIIKDGGLAVKYCINSNLTSGTILYGQPKNCELALFSEYEVVVSEDFAFDKGLLAVRGDVELGAGVIADGGFVKATIGG